MTPLQSLYTDALFRLSGLTWLEGLDLLLVMLAFYLLLSLLRRSRAGFLLRGTLALSALLLMITIVLPLPTFDWLIRVSLIAILVGLPIIFQPELRRLLERVGRATGMTRAVRQTAAEGSVAALVHAVESLAAGRTGALIAVEGNDSLQDVTETGVPFGGRVTSELLQSIFYPGTPLHDGAIVLLEDQVVAAGCVLPLTQRPLDFERRLGTRHRAAVGLSETCDALVVVVSEETGEISVARSGQLWRPLHKAGLREQLMKFYCPTRPASPPSTWALLKKSKAWLKPGPASHFLKGLLPNSSLFFVSALLALAAWAFVVEQANPAQRVRIDGIPLRVTDGPASLALVSSPPASVSAVIQTLASDRPGLRANSFQASVSLRDLSPGLHHLPVQITSGVSQVRILTVDPPTLDLELAAVISQTVPVMVSLPDQQHLSPAYKLVGAPLPSPNQVRVVGPDALVAQVNRVEATVFLANSGTSFLEVRPLRAVDQSGQEVSGVSLDPDKVLVRVPIQQRMNARDVGVRVLTSGVPPAGYWLSNLSVSPDHVTLQGEPGRLDKLGGFVDTLPINVSQASGNLQVQIPLDLPPEVKAVDSQGNVVGTVTVMAEIMPRSGDLVATRPIEVMRITSGFTATINPPQVNLLLSGPLPTLNRIKSDPGLIQVWIDAGQLEPGQSADRRPTFIAPEGIQVQVMPESVLIRVENAPFAWGGPE